MWSERTGSTTGHNDWLSHCKWHKGFSLGPSKSDSSTQWASPIGQGTEGARMQLQMEVWLQLKLCVKKAVASTRPKY